MISPARKELLRQIAGAILWALFLVLAPFYEVVLLGAVVWFPLLLWRERGRAKRYGFMPGAVWRFGTIGVITVLAVLAPTKVDDRRVGPLPRATVTLAELETAQIVFTGGDLTIGALPVSFSSSTPTRREVAEAIRAQTGLRLFAVRCGVGMNLLFGGYAGPYSLSGKASQMAPAPATRSAGLLAPAGVPAK